jgi:hypothetical protein
MKAPLIVISRHSLRSAADDNVRGGDRMRARWIKIGAALVVLAALAGGGVAWGTVGGDDESVTGPAADRARAAAIAHVGGGKVSEVERAEGGAGWEVEITRTDGSTVEVQLDENYGVTDVANDSEDSGDSGGDEDD